VPIEFQITLLYGAVNNYFVELEDSQLAFYQNQLFNFLMNSKIFNPHTLVLRNNNLFKSYGMNFLENFFVFYRYLSTN